MATYKQKLPSRQELWLVLGAAAFPVHIWAIINVMREVPAWILRLSLWDVIGVISYSLLFTLLETFILFAGVVLLALVLNLVLPRRWLADKLVPLATAVLFITAIWFVILQLNGSWITDRQLVPLAGWAASYLLVTAAAVFVVVRQTAVAQGLQTFAQRLLVLSILYLVVDVIGLVIIFVRNL